MKLNANAFGLAAAGTFAIVWIVCSLLVAALPDMTMMTGGRMMHMEVQDMQWSMEPVGLLVGLIAWSLVAGLIGWLMATFYNRLAK